MKLSKITATNFKGSSFSYELDPLTVFIGNNFKGKTRIIDAIIVALLGYHPSLGKTAKATFGLASGREMEVRAEFQMGPTIRRRFYLKGDTVKVDEDLPEAWDQVVEQLPVMLDASLYFSLTDRQRVDYVFANCALRDGWDAQSIMDRVRKKACADSDPKTFASWEECLLGDAKNDGALKPQAFIEYALERFTQIWKDSKASGERMEKAIQGVSELRAQDEAGIPLATLEGMAGQLTRKVADLNERRGRLLGSFTAMKAARIRREEIDRELRFGEKNATELLQATDKRRLLQEAIAALPAVTQSDVQNLWTAVCGHKNTADLLNTEISKQTKERERAERLLADMATKTECPYCGASGEGWKAINTAELNGAINDAKEAVADAQAKLKATRAKLEAAVSEHTKALGVTAERGRLESELAAVTLSINRLESTNGRASALKEERARLMADDPELTAQVEMLQTELNVQNEELRSVNEGLKKAQGRKLELQRLAAAEKARDEAKAEQAVAKAAGTELRCIQAEMVAAAFEPLLKVANSFFGPVLRAPLAYNPAGGEIGMWVDGQWIAHYTFSGTEKALTYAAMQMALASTGPFRLMLLDELGRIDPANVRKVLGRVVEAVRAGVIDNFIGIDVDRLVVYEDFLGDGENKHVVAVIEIE